VGDSDDDCGEFYKVLSAGVRVVVVALIYLGRRLGRGTNSDN
jgi:hypothetical protein